MGLIGLPSWPSTHNQLCGCPYTKNPDVPPSARRDRLRRREGPLIPFRKSRRRISRVWSRSFILIALICQAANAVYIRVKVWHPPPTGAHRVPSTSQFRQRLTSVGIGHARLNNNLPGSPLLLLAVSLLPLCSLLFSHRYTVSLSQGLGLTAAPTATEEEGEK